MEHIVDVGEGVGLYWVEVDGLREQDKNPQIMAPTMFGQLVANVNRRGLLESVPFCAIPAGEEAVQIVSGHKRVRAAREAGLKRIIVLVDKSGLSRGAVAAKVLAHNNIHGYSDLQVMAEVAAEIKDIEERLEAFLPPELDKLTVEPMAPLLSPVLVQDWKTVTLTFLPSQLEDFKELIVAMAGVQDLVGVADRGVFEKFSEALSKFGRFREIKSVGQVLAEMVRVTGDLMGLAGEDTREWVHITEVIGSGRIPQEVAERLRLVMGAAGIKAGEGWKLLAYLLDGKETI